MKDNTVETFVQILEENTRPGDSKRFEDPHKNQKPPTCCGQPMSYDSKFLKYVCHRCGKTDNTHKINP